MQTLGKPDPRSKSVPADWQPLLTAYLFHLTSAGRPSTTRETRRQHISRLARALNCAPGQVTLQKLERFYGSQTKWSREYRRGHRNSAASFFGWAHKSGQISSNPALDLPLVQADKPSPRPAPDRVWREAQVAADARTTVALRLACEAGLRRAEVAVVSTRDLVEGFEGWQLLVHGKGQKDRLIPITAEIYQMISAGAAGHTPGASSTGWLFPGDDGGHLSPRWVGTLCSRVMPGVWTMHTLRHRFATRVHRDTRNIRAVQELLGHASVGTTQRYTAVENSELRAAMNAAA